MNYEASNEKVWANNQSLSLSFEDDLIFDDLFGGAASLKGEHIQGGDGIREYIDHLDKKVQIKINNNIKQAMQMVLKKLVKFFDMQMGKMKQEQESKVDAIEARLVRKIIEFKKLISDMELRSEDMYYQNLQMRESMEIERAHAKKERKQRV